MIDSSGAVDAMNTMHRPVMSESRAAIFAGCMKNMRDRGDFDGVYQYMLMQMMAALGPVTFTEINEYKLSVVFSDGSSVVYDKPVSLIMIDRRG